MHQLVRILPFDLDRLLFICAFIRSILFFVPPLDLYRLFEDVWLLIIFFRIGGPLRVFKLLVDSNSGFVVSGVDDFSETIILHAIFAQNGDVVS